MHLSQTNLILLFLCLQPARHSKLEKADILEMTVKHLESLHKQQAAISTLTDKYRAGFSECASEVTRFPGLEPHTRKRLLQHLNNCLNSQPPMVASLGPNQDIQSRIAPSQNLQVHILPTPDSTSSVSSQNGIFLSAGANSGVQLVPTRLPNGDIALILPSTSAHNIQQRLSVSPTPSGTSSCSPPPLAMINHHSRSASTDSAASSNSPIGFERLSVNIPTSTSSADDMCHSPNSVHSSYSSPRSPGMVGHHYENYGMYSPPSQKPLSLVVRDGYEDMNDEKPWRPW